MERNVIASKLNYAFDHLEQTVLGTLDELEIEIQGFCGEDGQPDEDLHKKYDEILVNITSTKEKLHDFISDFYRRA